jgi:hypothetical protein
MKHLKRFNENLFDEQSSDINDDLKSNFRSWEQDHDTFDDTEKLSKILSHRHPDMDMNEIWAISCDWTGFDDSQNEAFLIPKPARKFMPFWKDEEVALTLLSELKKMKATPENISRLNISSTNDNFINFDLGEYNFDVKYDCRLDLQNKNCSVGVLKMNGEHCNVSVEVCKKIQKEILRLKNSNDVEVREYDKKDFLRTYKK